MAWRIARGVVACLAGMAIGGALAQAARTDCASLPEADRAAARRAGSCIDVASPAVAAPAVDRRAIAAQIPGLPVPELRNAPLNRSDSRIGRFKLETSARPSTRPLDWVLDQQPAPGSRLPVGGTLRLTLSDGSLVVVPGVIGSDPANARSRLQESRLRATIESVRGEPVGRVIAQSPSAGAEVSRGSVVTLRVAAAAPPTDTKLPPPESKAPPPAVQLTVPNVIGLPYDDALQRLSRFKPERSHRAAIEPGGQVIAQEPAAGTQRPPGSSIAIVLSDGSLTTVPDVRGLSSDRASARISEAGLKMQRIDTSSEQPQGRVIGQTPLAGEPVARASSVRVQVSSGPADIELPNVVGLGVDSAITQLGEFTVTRAEASSTSPRGQVIAQQPPGGTRARRGASVALTVSAGQEVIEVPDVIDSDVQAAQTRLSEFRVTVMPVPGRPPAQRVIAQSPTGRTMQPPGAPVTLSVSDGSITDPTPPTVTTDAAPTSKAVWWTIAGGVAVLMLAAGIVVGRAGAPSKPVHVQASASLDLAPDEARVDGAAPLGAPLQIEADLEHGEVTIEPHNPEAS